MPLRPVSELGLVDLTDLASPEAKKPASRRTSKPKGSSSAKKSSGTSKPSPAKRSSAAATSKVNTKAARARSGPRSTTSSSPVAATDRGEKRRIGPSVVKFGVPLLSGAAVVAGALLVGRTALQR
jgi:hypothetical protein